MTEYWKSYAKKFCEICKCWYADNRVSAERHEQGLKHKAMVQQRLRDSAKKARDREVEDHDLRMTLLAMDQAARASINSREQREVPTVAGPRPCPQKQVEPNETDEARAELREQKRKLKELKRKSKQSQCWVDDDDEGGGEKVNIPPKDDAQKSERTTTTAEWVQAETPDSQAYYWHIFTGETRWDTPLAFYTSEQYAERYAEIAADAATRAHFSGGGQQSSSTSASTDHDQLSTEMIDPRFVGQMSSAEVDQQLGEDQQAPPPKKAYYGQRETEKGKKKEKNSRWGREREEKSEETGQQLSREERRKIKRERKAMAEAEADKVPEGLVELKYEQPETGHNSDEYKPQLEKHSHPLGPWVPVKKKEERSDLNTVDQLGDDGEQQPAKKGNKKHYNDLPAQEYGPGSSVETPAELLELAELEPDDLAFGAKMAPAGTVAKPAKKGGGKAVIGFRKPASGVTKSLRKNAT